MKIILTLFILFANICINQAQVYKSYQIGHGRSPLILEEEPSPVESHTYLKDEWIQGNMVVKDGGLLSNVEFKYDILNDKIEFKSVLNPQSIEIVTIGEKFFIYSEFTDGDFIRSGYFQMLFDGKTKLLIRRTVKVMPGKKGAYGFNPYSTVTEHHYIKIGDKPAIPFDKRKGEIVDILAIEKVAIKEYVKSNKINTRRDSELIKLLLHFDEL